MKYKLYEVGGKIRDELIGLKSKDVDYAVVLDINDWKNVPMEEVFNSFVEQIESEGFVVFKKDADVVTVRAKFPQSHKYSGDADFVISRKELYYPEGSRRPVCELGTLEDDLLRRDFTLNALAKGEDGKIIDLYNGTADLMEGILCTPADPYKSFRDDPLRIIRGMRFCITKDFVFGRDVRNAIREIGIKGLDKVSKERIAVELDKCFAHSTPDTLSYLYYMKKHLNFDIINYAFDGTGLRLTTLMKKVKKQNNGKTN